MTERREAGINSIGKKKPDLKPQLSDQTRFQEKGKSANQATQMINCCGFLQLPFYRHVSSL